LQAQGLQDDRIEPETSFAQRICTEKVFAQTDDQMAARA